MNEALLDIRDLSVEFATRRGAIRAVSGVSMAVRAGERFALAGESGSGKTTLALAVLGLIKPPGRITGGQVVLNGRDLTRLTAEELRKVRLREAAWIPQGAMNALNPVMTVGKQMALALRAHGEGGSGAALRDRIRELLGRVELPGEVARRYPHELSGGMKQRVCVAMAICLAPRLILADEPTSALDVIVQRRIMQTLHRLQQETQTAILLVGHDMGLMAKFAQRVGVMYAGRLVEVGPTKDIFEDPLHPYTRLLITSIPTFEDRKAAAGGAGAAPSLLAPISGCPFRPRCSAARPRCEHAGPSLQSVSADRQVACLMYEKDNHAPPA